MATNLVARVAPGFESVKDVFVKHFEPHPNDEQELGSSFVVFVDGKEVVSLTAGWCDEEKTKPYTEDTIQVIHSAGKTIMAITIAHLVSRGLLDYDKPVAHYWPEFAQGGKEGVLVRDLLMHSGGVEHLDLENVPTKEELHDLDKLAAKVARQKHNNDGKLVKSYHAITRGWYLNELVRRVTDKKETNGRILREKVNPALGTQLHCGLPESLLPSTSQVFEHPGLTGMMKIAGGDPNGRFYKALIQSIPRLPDSPANETTVGSNNKWGLTAEVPSGYHVTNAKSLAKLGALMANGGSLPELPDFISPKTLAKAEEEDPRTKDLVDMCLGQMNNYLVGGWAKGPAGKKIPQSRYDITVQPPKSLYSEDQIGEGWEWRGWFGYGGMLFQWEKNHKISVGYVQNKLLAGLGGDWRNVALVTEVVKCVEKLKAAGK
ncbi:beta-lactamase/transpeptidase-like protein [Hyaloraphidium curvatum]|nr:beta-lactamase/transpeptidase-like protein [Hyaloraphidium curvatum]